MILETNQMIVYETGSASRKSEIAELKEVHFEGSIDFKVTVKDSGNLEHTYLCHLVKDNLKWLLGVEINEFMECEDESYFVNSLQVELDNLHEHKTIVKTFIKNYHVKRVPAQFRMP